MCVNIVFLFFFLNTELLLSATMFAVDSNCVYFPFLSIFCYSGQNVDLRKLNNVIYCSICTSSPLFISDKALLPPVKYKTIPNVMTHLKVIDSNDIKYVCM